MISPRATHCDAAPHTVHICDAQLKPNHILLTKAPRNDRAAMQMASPLSSTALLILVAASASWVAHSATNGEHFAFPGVTRELASFCAARPSLPVNLASMVVHVKKNTSFNYKLYLFSADHVVQTGQVVPRADFRIHSFPVKVKHLNEFWPKSVATFQYANAQPDSLVPVSSSSFNLRQFLKHVPLNPQVANRRRQEDAKKLAGALPHDAHGEPLPGDSHPTPKSIRSAKSKHNNKRNNNNPTDTTNQQDQNFNKHIQFDRDDQVSLTRRVPDANDYTVDAADSQKAEAQMLSLASDEFRGEYVIPVGAFSSFHVNLTYLVRKDFDQREPQLIQIRVDAANFSVTQVQLISNGTQNLATYPQNEDYNFLTHKLLRDPNTRITAINQIYEDWITRNFYTIVYVQRRLDEVVHETGDRTIVNDRLIFRGTSIALLGADQLDYSVKAAAFITEKNGLHYYLEFLPTNKFYLCAVDWSRRPFKMIDSRQFPIKATQTLLDNEELLLCPPAVCYSNRPIDEIVSYGRIPLTEANQREVSMLTAITPSTASADSKSVRRASLMDAPVADLLPSEPGDELTLATIANSAQSTTTGATKIAGIRLDGHDATNRFGGSIANLAEFIKSSSMQLDIRLHLRDWIWPLKRKSRTLDSVGSGNAGAQTTGQLDSANNQSSEIKFELRYETAKRNDIKPKPDAYGFVLTGHEIDATYRVYNELYLISTVISSHPISEEFLGLSSTLIDPITGAFYDRFTNQIYFFKGDRYVGYDYASKKPLEDFQLQAPAGYHDPTLGTMSNAIPLVSSLPVVGILGRQHHVDAIYHDFASDLVYIFTAMKFYTFEAAEFKDGTFKTETNTLPELRCINEYFLSGCHFDEAYPNPCRDDDTDGDSEVKSAKQSEDLNRGRNETEIDNSAADFTEEQQMKLRSIAARGGLLDVLVENTILSRGKVADPTVNAGNGSQPQERIIVYLLVAMVGLTVLVTVAMIVVIINWIKIKSVNSEQTRTELGPDRTGVGAASFGANINRPTSHYMTNQQQYHTRRQHRQYHNQSQYLNSRSRTSDHSKDKSLGTVVVSKSRRQSSNVDNSVL